MQTAVRDLEIKYARKKPDEIIFTNPSNFQLPLKASINKEGHLPAALLILSKSGGYFPVMFSTHMPCECVAA